ncbi:hypothetical protein Fcan01_14215 [Folsomia candida]|uniref:F-box domain-containing protein n=1 Tax=Folsomia candida TaxID=158441 RepID=A0A226E2E2_FOLCA|nr:hypothetical protein Fcan01_14215 [Folsomia candida]
MDRVVAEGEEEVREERALYRSCLPLEIPCILNQILRYLPYQDLQSCRLVAQQFNEEACRVLRKRSKIVLSSPKRFIAFNLEMLNPLKENRYCEHFQLINAHVTTPAVTMFLDKFQKCIKSFELKDAKWSCHELTTILTETVKNLEELILHGAIPKDSPRLFMTESEEAEQNLNPILVGALSRPLVQTPQKPIPKLPNIKQLDLQLYDKLPDDEVLSQFGADLLKAAYNLEELRSRDTGKWRSKRERFQRILFELLISPEADIVLPKLRKVAFSLSPWNDEQIKRLAMKQFPLRYLSLTILPDISAHALTSLLISLKDTLTKLKLSFTSWRIMEFPVELQLHKLQHLSLDWFNGSISFISRMENLRTLVLAQIDLNEMFNESEFTKFKRPIRTLSSVEVYQHSGTPVTSSVVRNMSTLFPRVTTLVLGKLDDDSLRTVFTVYPLLESFSAIEGAFSDFGVIGVDTEIVDTFNLDYLETTHTFGHIAEIQYALAKMTLKKFILNGIVAPTFVPSISPEIRDFLTQFHDNVCRSIISHMKHRSSPPYDHDLTIYHNMRHQHRQNLFLIYEACMAEQYALQGLISIGNAI